MIDLIVVVVGIMIGIALGRVIDRVRTPHLPATKRQIDRARRANRLRLRRPGDPWWMPLPEDHFSDDEETR